MFGLQLDLLTQEPFSVAEHVSVPGQRGLEVTRGNGTKTERLRVPLRKEGSC